MRLPAFANTLHFRLSALFLILLGVSGVVFWFWIDATVLSADMAAEEEDWYEYQADSELDSLALALGQDYSRLDAFDTVLTPYIERVDRFDAELIVFDSTGVYLASTHPESLGLAVPTTDSQLLADMSKEDWDFSSYPLQDNVDAYENRIFSVAPLHQNGDPEAPIVGYVAASFEPMIIGIAELDRDTRTIGFQALVLALLYSAISGLIIMGWTTRRLRGLTAGVAEFASGNLAFRVNAGSRDEIGALGRGFNALAEGMESNLEQLQKNEQFQRQLIANISHDLRTPLSSLRGYVESLSIQAQELTPEQRRQYLDIITGNLDHLDRLIERTLVLSRFDSGQTRFQMEEFLLPELVDSVLMRCQAVAERRNVELKLKSPERPALVMADPLQVAQVLQNLIENGIKFNRDGGRVEVALGEECGRTDGRVEVCVRDTGLGIPEADLPRIFDRFYTGSESRTRAQDDQNETGMEHMGQSVGLGLAIAAKIVNGHGSQLTVESVEGQGTRFRFSLQAVADVESAHDLDRGRA